MTIFAALVVGKVIGVTCIVLLASRCKVAPLSEQMRPADITMISAMASIGLTVALFIAGEAYKQETLKAEAKMGALLSGLMGVLCILFSRSPMWRGGRKKQLDAPRTSARDSWREDGYDSDDPEYDDTNDVAYIVAAALESTYAHSRAAIQAKERKAILAGKADALRLAGPAPDTISPMRRASIIARAASPDRRLSTLNASGKWQLSADRTLANALISAASTTANSPERRASNAWLSNV